jgi:hypothetical protein
LKQPHDDNDGRNDQQQVDQPSAHLECKETEEPQDQQNGNNGPEHFSLSFELNSDPSKTTTFTTNDGMGLCKVRTKRVLASFRSTPNPSKDPTCFSLAASGIFLLLTHDF